MAQPRKRRICQECSTRDEALADMIAKRASKEFFATLGINSDDPQAVEEFRENLRFGRQIRKLVGHGVLGVVSVLAAGLAAAIWTGVSDAIRRGG
mgnify:FL=1